MNYWNEGTTLTKQETGSRNPIWTQATQHEPTSHTKKLIIFSLVFYSLFASRCY